jgi:elongation factor Ts
MAEITAASVKELRERTGAGMMDCKKALAETSGEMEAAIDWLRAKGLSAAAKKAGRTAAEGLVGAVVEGNRGALVEVNSETDFVAKNELFQDFVRNVAKLVLEHGSDVEALAAAQYPGGGTVQEQLTENIAKIGENQSLRRAAVLEVGHGAVVPYVHNQVAPGLGKIGVLVALESGAPCTSRPRTRSRSAATICRPSWSSASARSPWKRRAKAESPRISSRRWSRAALPSSARTARSCRNCS